MSHHTALKNEQVILENDFFFFSLNGEADTDDRQLSVNMIMPFTGSKSYLIAKEIKDKKKKKRGKAEVNRIAIFV